MSTLCRLRLLYAKTIRPTIQCVEQRHVFYDLLPEPFFVSTGVLLQHRAPRLEERPLGISYAPVWREAWSNNIHPTSYMPANYTGMSKVCQVLATTNMLFGCQLARANPSSITTRTMVNHTNSKTWMTHLALASGIGWHVNASMYSRIAKCIFSRRRTLVLKTSA